MEQRSCYFATQALTPHSRAKSRLFNAKTHQKPPDFIKNDAEICKFERNIRHLSTVPKFSPIPGA
jgi:hypothetical protein